MKSAEPCNSLRQEIRANVECGFRRDPLQQCDGGGLRDDALSQGVQDDAERPGDFKSEFLCRKARPAVVTHKHVGPEHLAPCERGEFAGIERVAAGRNGDTPRDIFDIVHDLDVFPYPLADDSFDQILMQDVIEHVSEPIRVLEELHRIGRPGARIHIRTPHYSSVLAYGDPTHKHYVSTIAIRSLAEPRFAHYTDVRFRVVRVTLDSWTPFRLSGIGALANRFQIPYETYFAFWFPSMNVQAEFEVVK